MKLLCVLFAIFALTSVAWADASARIDELLEKEWAAKGVQAGEIVSDEVFLRRIYLDVAGRIPTLEEARRFLDATPTDKRAQLIDELLAGDGHANHLFTFFADLLRLTDAGGKSAVVARAYVEWVKAQLRADRPYDEMVREMVSSYGMAYDTGAVG